METKVQMKKGSLFKGILIITVFGGILLASLFNLEFLSNQITIIGSKLGIYSDEYYCKRLADNFQVGDSILLSEEIFIKSANDFWDLYLIQPVITSYTEKDGITIAKGVVKTSAGECETVQLIVGGDLKVETYSDFNNGFKKVSLDDKYISLDDFKKKVPVGTQIGAYYLGRKAESLEIKDALCSSSPSYEYFCDIELIGKSYSDGFVAEIKDNTDFSKLPKLFIPSWKTEIL